jgi:hypothetical protein
MPLGRGDLSMQFMKSASRALAMLALPLSLLTPACAVEQTDNAPALAAPAGMPEGLQRVKMIPTTYGEMTRKYPFLHEMLDPYAASAPPPPAEPLIDDYKDMCQPGDICYATVQDKATGTDLLLLSLDDAGHHGALGHALYVYKKTASSGYKQVADLIAPASVSVLKEQKTVSLVFDTRGGGLGLWQDKGAGYEYVRKYKDDEIPGPTPVQRLP